jgi:hypothetical protein
VGVRPRFHLAAIVGTMALVLRFVILPGSRVSLLFARLAPAQARQRRFAFSMNWQSLRNNQ